MTTPPRQRAVTRPEFEALAARVDEDHAIRADSNAKINAMFDALMVPQPGHEKSLLERMAETTIDIESGQRVGRMIVRTVGVISAISAAIATFYAAIRFGGSLKP